MIQAGQDPIPPLVQPGQEPSSPQEDWRRAVASLRDTAKWIIAALAGVGAAVLGVLPVTAVSRVDTLWTVALALLGVVLAIAGVILGIWAASNVLTPQVLTLRSVADMPSVVAAIEQDPSTYLSGAGATLDEFLIDLAGWRRTVRDLEGVRGADAGAEQRRVQALDIARANLESRAGAARQIVALSHFKSVSARFSTARTLIFVSFAVIAAGTGLFLAATVIGDNEDEAAKAAANAGRPVSVRLALSAQGKAELRDRLGDACIKEASVDALLWNGDWVTVTYPRSCNPVAIRWDSSLGTVST